MSNSSKKKISKTPSKSQSQANTTHSDALIAERNAEIPAANTPHGTPPLPEDAAQALEHLERQGESLAPGAGPKAKAETMELALAEQPLEGDREVPAEEGDISEPQPTGLLAYQDHPGELLGSVDRLGMLESIYWETSPLAEEVAEDFSLLARQYGSESRPGGNEGQSPSDPSGASTAELGFVDGPLYPGYHTVMESDSYGMRLSIRLSEPANGRSELVLQFGGTAQMALFGVLDSSHPDYVIQDDYVHWRHWTITTAQGDFPATDIMRENADGTFSLTLPEGVTSFFINVPLLDNTISQPDRLFSYRVLSTGGYTLTEGEAETIRIIDEDKALPPDDSGDPGFVYPEPGDPGIDTSIHWGATARIQVKNASGLWGHENTVMENQAGNVEYRFQLVDTVTGKPIVSGPQEDIRITLTITGENGLVIDPFSSEQDFKLLENIETAFRNAGYTDAAYNDATGKLTFTIPKGMAGPHEVLFEGKPIADTRDETRADGLNESLVITVTAEGNEVISGKGTTTQVAELPIVSVTVNHDEIYELPGQNQGNAATFTFSLASSFDGRGSIPVAVEWLTGTGYATAEDYEWYLGGVKQTGPLPDVITFPAGRNSVAITVVAIDDQKAEGDEIITVALKPGNGYLVNPAANTETVTIHDGTIPPPTVELEIIDGLLYPGEHTVMESDSYGMRLGIRLSKPSNGSDALQIEFGGTAQMALPDVQDASHPDYNVLNDYVHWQHWTIFTAAGDFPATDIMTDNGDGTFSLLLPSGVTSFSIGIPLLDNAVSQENRTFTYKVLNSGGYVLTDGETGTITIIDEDKTTTPPEAPDTPIPPPSEPGDIHWGATARIQVEIEPGQWGYANTVMENQTAPVNYRFQLVDTVTGEVISTAPGETITVSIAITGKNGLVLDPLSSEQDFKLLESIETAFFTAGYADASYDAGTGKLTFTITDTMTGPHEVAFTGQTVPDTRDESRADNALESLTFTVSAEGYETISGKGVTTSIVDVPTVSVTADSDAIFESNVAGHDLKNTVTFTFSLSSTVAGQENMPVNLEWGSGAGYVTAADYTWYLDGVEQTGALPSSITFPAGQKTVAVKVVAVDDKLTENDELITVAIKPENALAPVTDNYHVHATDNAWTVTLYDDTTSNAYGENGKYNDGPSVRIMACDNAGNVIGTSGCSISEISGEVYFRPVLFDRVTGLEVTAIDEDVTVTFTISPKNAATIIGLSSASQVNQDIVFDTSDTRYAFTAVYSDPPFNTTLTHYTVEVTVAKAAYDAGPENYIFKGGILADSNVETNEGLTFAVTGTQMHESKPGGSYEVNFTDAPVVSIAVESASYYEDSGSMKFTVSTDVTVQQNTEIWLELTGAGGNAEDLDLSGLTVVTQTDSSNATHTYILVTIPSGQNAKVINIPIKDDVYSPKPDGGLSSDGKEADEEAVTLTIVGQGGVNNPTSYPPYGISTANSQAGTKIIDDSTSHPGHDAHPDGPAVVIFLTKADGTILDARTAQALESAGETIHYKVCLFERDGAGNRTDTPYTAVQDVALEIDVNGYSSSNSTLDFKNAATKDFAFSAESGVTFAFTPHDTNVERGTIKLTIPVGQNAVAFKGSAIPDTLLDEEGEKFDLTITKVNGNETVLGSATEIKVVTEIRDAPVAKIFFGDGPGGEVDRSHYSESEGSFSFTVTISDTSTEDITVYLDWTGTDPGILPAGKTLADLPTSVVIRAGNSSVTTPITMADNALTAMAKDIKVELKHDSGNANAAGQKYFVGTSDNSLVGKVHDDTETWDTASWGTKPLDHGTLEGPKIILILKDAGGVAIDSQTAAEIRENGGVVQYELRAVDKATGLAYTVQQDITVTLDVNSGTANSLSTGGTDIKFSLVGTVGTVSPVDDSNGKMTVVIPKNASSVTFKGTAQADTTPEYVTRGLDASPSQEQVTVGITSVHGNEAIYDGTTKTVTIIDVPTVSVAAERNYYSESRVPGTNSATEMVFTFTLTSPPMSGVTVRLGWGGTATPGTDYNSPPSSITFAAGQTEYVLRVPIIDDNVTENNETVIVTVLPENGAGTANVNDNYHVDGAKKSATTTIVDDTKPWPVNVGPEDPDACPAHHGSGAAEEHARLDGPVAVIYATTGNHNALGDPRYEEKKEAGDTRYNAASDPDGRTAIALEKIGTTHNDITYRVDLNTRKADGTASGTVYSCNEQVTLEMTIAPKVNLAGSQYQSTYGDDFYLDDAALNAMVGPSKALQSYTATLDSGTGALKLVVTLNKNVSGFDLPMKITTDTLTEINRKIYNPTKAQNNDPDPFDYIEDEAFVISIDKASGNEAAVDPNKGAITTIIDEDHEGLFVSLLQYTGGPVLEGAKATFTLVLSHQADEAVTVVLRPKPASNESGSSNHPASVDDFEAGDLQVTFNPGEDSKTFTVQTKQDMFSEGTEWFDIEIIYVSGGEAQINQQQKSTTCAIVDNMDGPVVGLTYAVGNIFHESSLVAGEDVAGQVHFTLTLTDPASSATKLAPVEAMVVTLKIEGDASDFDLTTDNFKILDDAIGDPDKQIKVLEVKSDGTVIIEIPAGYAGPTGNGKVDFTLGINDDHLTEQDKTFTIKVHSVEGSEGTVSTDSDKNKVTGTIVDDPTTVATDNLSLEDANKLLDGPYVSLKGTLYVSESATTDYGNQKAGYRIELHDENGSLYTSQEAVTVYVKYSSTGACGAVWGNEFRADENLYPRTTLNIGGVDVTCVKVTIPAGKTCGTFEFEILDSSIKQDNTEFDLEIVKVEGNEARLMDSAFKNTNAATQGLSDSIHTVIVDDTKEWKSEYNQTYCDGDGVEHSACVKGNHGETGKLDGLTLTLSKASGNSWVYESADDGKVEYIVATDDIQSRQPVTVTMKLAFNNGMTVEDFANIPAGTSDADKLTLLAAAIKTANPGSTAADINIQYVDGDPAKGVTFEVVFPSNGNMISVFVPIYNDTLTESGESYTLSLHKADGSEAQIKAGQSSVTTAVHDDSSGPVIRIQCWDNSYSDGNSDGIKEIPGWTRISSIIGNPAHGEYDDESCVQFKVYGTKTADEDVTARVRLCGVDASTPLTLSDERIASILAANTDVTYDSGYFYVTIEKGQTSVILNVPKIPLSDGSGLVYKDSTGRRLTAEEVEADPDNAHLEYSSQRYTAVVSNPVGGESYLDSSNNYAEVEIIQSSSDGPWTYVTIKA